MKDTETVYRIRYTADNRIKSVHASERPKTNERCRTFVAWLIVLAGALACVGWWYLWA